MQQSEKELLGLLKYGVSILVILHLISSGEYIGALLVIPAVWLLSWLFAIATKLLIALL